MSRTPNTHGGGARTNKNGLHFEQTTSLDNALCNAGYKVTNYEVYRGSQKIGMSVPQKKLFDHEYSAWFYVLNHLESFCYIRWVVTCNEVCLVDVVWASDWFVTKS